MVPPPSSLLRAGTALALVAAALAGCGHDPSRLAFGLDDRISYRPSAADPRRVFRERVLRETTLDDLPEGQASEGDAIVRVLQTGVGPCSGALVGPRHVLTAAHCVVERSKDVELAAPSTTPTLPGRLHVELGGDYLPWGRVGVVGLRLCDGYAADAARDLAILVLARPVPAEVPIFTLAADDDAPAEATVFSLSGYGTPAVPASMPGSGWGVYSVRRHTRSGPALHQDPDVFVAAIHGSPGDSGGPIVDRATGQLVSVVSVGRRPATAGELSTDSLVMGPRLASCRRAIDETLAR